MRGFRIVKALPEPDPREDWHQMDLCERQHNAGKMHIKNGDHKAALTAFQQANDHIDTDAENHYHIGLMHHALGQHKEAIAAHTAAIHWNDTDPNDRSKYFAARSEAHRQHGIANPSNEATYGDFRGHADYEQARKHPKGVGAYVADIKKIEASKRSSER